MNNRIISGVLTAAMVLSTLLATIPPVFSQGDIITISSKEDLITFSKNCTLDTWSQGKTVTLTCDIDLGGSHFPPIPTFGGTFDGNGHTISGVNCSSSGSYLGLFRYIQQGATVTSLTVKAAFAPNGSKSFIGGIAGENYGTIENCTFEGTVTGENTLGGIVGHNTESGQIISCVSSGGVIGENSSGGIAGKNDGLILNCTNYAAVNTVYEEKEKSISDIDADTGAMIENYKNKEEENEEESLLGHSDTGGIVGYTSGIVQGCTNHAAVGYQHIGYNVGGIAGRQSGYLLGCQNFGFIQGRKDVGGIAGQAEPYILLHTSESTLQDLRQELNTLHSMIDKFITDTDSLGSDAEQHFTDISEHARNAQNNTELLLNQGTDFIDNNLGELNAQAAILSNTLDKLIPVFNRLENGSDLLADALNKAATALGEIELSVPDLSDRIDDIRSALSDISKAERSVKKAAQKAKKAGDNLDDAIEFKNQAQVKKAAKELSEAIGELATARQTIKTAIEAIETILQTKPEDFESIGIHIREILDNIKTIKENVTTTVSSLQTIEKSLGTIASHTEINFSSFRSAAQNMQSAVEYLGDAMHYITGGLEDLATAIKRASDELTDDANDVREQLHTAKNNLADATASLSYAADDIRAAIGEIKQIITDLSNEEPASFVVLGDTFKQASDSLFHSLSGISGEIDQLKQTVSGGRDAITGNLTAISNQFNVVMNLLIGGVEKLESGSNSVSDLFLDASDEDIEHTKQGKVAECHNFGNVQADRNTGGIAGAMAIEYSKDPEDEIEKPDTLKFTYQTKAILQACINDGNIIGKKDCTGGITGLAELGTVYECENYGSTESTNGNYVGGISGKSESAIRKSYAKGKLTGKRYVGGIAGKAEVITACDSIVTVSGEENTGSICGGAENKDRFYQNFFVDNGLGAIDGISYSDKASPIRFEELAQINGIPAKFISFTVTFVADGAAIATQELKYGDNTAKIKYPKIPEKEDHFGKWQPIEAETVTENLEVVCEYLPYITVLASAETNENGKLALALAEGKFTDKANLHITESKELPPAKADGITKVYEVALSGVDIRETDPVTLRLLNENKDKVTAWQLKDNHWEKLDAAERGKYVVLQAAGTNSTICLQYTERRFHFIWILLLLFVAGATVFVCIKKKKK